MGQAADHYVVVAKVGAPHGVRGDLKLYSFLHKPKDILSYPVLFLQLKPGQPWQLLADYHIRPSGDHFLLNFIDYPDRDQARRFVNALLAIPRDALQDTPENEYYWTDLEGLQVFHTDGTLLGTVDHLIETGQHDVLVLKGERERLIPFVSQHVLAVDLKVGTIEVDWDPSY